MYRDYFSLSTPGKKYFTVITEKSKRKQEKERVNSRGGLIKGRYRSKFYKYARKKIYTYSKAETSCMFLVWT